MPYKNSKSIEAKQSADKRLKKYRDKNRQVINDRDRERRKNDPLYRQKCINKSNRYKLRNRDKVLLYKKKNNLKKLYGVSWETYSVILESQDGGCAICGGINESGRKLAVDHNHETGEIRGLLCDKCNRGLGFFNDDIMILDLAVEYLGKYV